MELIPLDAVLAEIENRIKELQNLYKENEEKLDSIQKTAILLCIDECKVILSLINTLEVKEVDLDGERRKYLTEHFNVYEDGILQSKRSNLPLDTYDVIKITKHFFELGMQVGKPITAADRGMAEEIIINLKRVEQDYRINLTKEMEWLRNKVKKGE